MEIKHTPEVKARLDAENASGVRLERIKSIRNLGAKWPLELTIKAVDQFSDDQDAHNWLEDTYTVAERRIVDAHEPLLQALKALRREYISVVEAGTQKLRDAGVNVDDAHRTYDGGLEICGVDAAIAKAETQR